MKLEEQITIRASVDTVWPMLADPAHWAQWHNKLVELRRDATGPLRGGEHFHATFQLKRRPRPCQVQVRECLPPTRLALREEYEHQQRFRHVDITFELHPDGEGTRVCQQLDLRGTGIPWVLRAFIWWIHRFGRPVGLSPLERLRQLIERENPQLPAFVATAHPERRACASG